MSPGCSRGPGSVYRARFGRATPRLVGCPPVWGGHFGRLGRLPEGSPPATAPRRPDSPPSLPLLAVPTEPPPQRRTPTARVASARLERVNPLASAGRRFLAMRVQLRRGRSLPPLAR